MITDPIRDSGRAEEAAIRTRLLMDVDRRMRLVREHGLSTLQIDPPGPQPAVAKEGRVFKMGKSVPDDRAQVLYLSALANTGRVRHALDALYDMVDGFVRKEEFARCDHLFASVQADRMSLQMVVGLLTITLRFKDRLPHRVAFMQAARETLHNSDPEKADRLFAGLV